MPGTSLNKNYPWISPEGMVDDPAKAAVELNLVGNHSVAARRAVGAWRWPLVSKYAPEILPGLARGYVVDFGGAAGPIGYEAITVDYGAPVKSLFDLPGKIDTLFSSHTFEHVADLDLLMVCLREKVSDLFIVQVPHCRKSRLLPENWPFHQQAFYLSSTPAELRAPGARCLDELFAPWCRICIRDEDEENIFMVAQRDV